MISVLRVLAEVIYTSSDCGQTAVKHTSGV
jgi:hypothetical protein